MVRTTSLRTPRLQVEPLEGRALPALVEWINPAGGDWAVPENWSTGQLPSADDDVLIDLPPDFSVIHSQGDSTVRSLTNRETLVLLGGTLSLTADSTSDGDVQLAGGTLTGARTFTVNGRFLWTSGAMSRTNFDFPVRTVTNGGLLIVGPAPKDLGRALENHGWAYVMGGDIRMNLADFRNESNGTLDLDGVRFVQQFFSTFGTSGLMRVRNGVGISLSHVGLNGTVEVHGGGLFTGAGVGGGVSWAGTIRLFLGARLGASTDNFESGASITGDGGVGINVDRGGLGGQELNVTGDVSIQSISGNLSYRTATIGGQLHIDAIYGGISSPDLQANAVTIRSSSGATIRDAQITTGAFLLTGGGRSEIRNSTITAATFANASVDVTDSHISADVFTSSGVLTVRGSTTFTARDGFVNTGDLVGTVRIEGDVMNSGWIRPFGNEPGLVVITGNFTQTATGAITVGLGGTEPGTGYDQIQVGGIATLDGRLDVHLRNGFVPREGDRFDVLTFADRVGAFATISVPQFDDDLFLDPIYGEMNLALVAVRR